MTDGYQVVVEELRRASVAADDMAEIAGRVDFAGTVGRVGQALPGSKSAQSASKVGRSWKNQVSQWSQNAAAYATKLASAADKYTENESQSIVGLQSLNPVKSGPSDD